ncbi:4Fe-4S dicluster domain-containing protein [Micromonospora sp. NPDC023956]|uniref:4Fe-4S dicluster domain-containing protein n=1 Tax=Micromonospora sp. NPDC023956 TaxID=3155722 RepID=UPI0033EF3DFB
MTTPDDTVRTSRGTLVIDTEKCKGCDLCVLACPPEVLVMSAEVNEMGYRFPELTPGCTGCTACQMVCPDFVFSVYRLTPPPRPSGADPSP